MKKGASFIDHRSAFRVFSWPVRVYYLKPAAFDDELAVTVELEKLRAGQIILMQRIARGPEELATARVRLACVNTATFRPVRIPSSLSSQLGRRAAYGTPREEQE